jgi:hypothetical protein
MAVRLVQINFKYNVPRADFEAAEFPMAPDFAAIPGLKWKLWIINEDESEAGGIMLFENPDAANAFLNSELAGKVTGHPALSDFSVKLFDIQQPVTGQTRGPA